IYLILLGYGPGVALTGTALYAFAPVTFMNVPPVTTDFTFTFFSTLTIFSLLQWYHQKKILHSCLTGFLLGLALASKASGILLFLPVIVAFMVAMFHNKRADLVLQLLVLLTFSF